MIGDPPAAQAVSAAAVAAAVASSTTKERKFSTTTKRFLSPSSSQKFRHEVNVALAGPRGCGKSALAVRYMARRYIGEYDPRLGEKLLANSPICGKCT